jgi:hypothetical protein
VTKRQRLNWCQEEEGAESRWKSVCIQNFKLGGSVQPKGLGCAYNSPTDKKEVIVKRSFLSVIDGPTTLEAE